ncbi:putative ATP-dependent RNA helicase DHX57 [Physella acuta]|uniref:putative ATP-dependent RNA helicase DHX57 n=1 Tax=Physella acuta TaxID=109671 RepID=UPI0027DB846B|nr:putative ATP-dependent RNA helicase DHX57 [Physella acuta]
MESVRRGRPNRGGGRHNKRGRGGRGRGLIKESNEVKGAKAGWSSSRKGGLDIDDSLDGPVVNVPHSNPHQAAKNTSSNHQGYAFSGTSSARGRGSGPKVKLEMQRLFMSEENQEMVRRTLESVYSREVPDSDEEDVGVDYEQNYDELDYRGDNDYWMTDHTLEVQDAIRFNSDVQRERSVKAVGQENSFAIKKLQRCGFSSDLCLEALQICDWDAGEAQEYLLNDLFNNSLKVTGSTESTPDFSEEEMLEAREEEKMALQSIYDADFEERIPNRTWMLNLELPELVETVNLASPVVNAGTRLDKKLCPFYFKGQCRFKDRCRYSHAAPVDNVSRSAELSHPIYSNLKALESANSVKPFSIEIRFPTGNKYPYEPPLLAFSSRIEEFPAYTRLNISQFLMSVAKESAECHLPCIFTIVNALEDVDKLKLLVSLPPPAISRPVTIEQSKLFSPPKPAWPLTVLQSSSGQNLASRQFNRDQDVGRNERYGQPKNDDVQKRHEGYAQLKKKSVQPYDAIEIKRQNKILQEEFMQKKGLKQYQNMQVERQRLPAWEMRDMVLEVIERNQVVVISGMTGCGKTTQVPQFLLDAALMQRDFNTNIVCTQPRRISAMSVAQRVANERAEKLGRSVGYNVRLESLTSPYTRLLFCTIGIILRRLEADPQLEGVSHIIIDEVHERSEESDFLLMILRDVLVKRPDLKVILMSATMNANLFSCYFGGCPVLEIPGRTFPVEQFFLEDVIEFTGYQLEEKSPYARSTKGGRGGFQKYGGGLDAYEEDWDHDLESDGTTPRPASDKSPDMCLTTAQLQMRYPDYSQSTIKALHQTDMDKINYDIIILLLHWIKSGEHEFPDVGAILIFLPGFAEIQTLYDMIKTSPEFGQSKYNIIPLHSTLSSYEQNAVFVKAKEGVTKIVIATNIAETSITIDDIVYVIDVGKMKEKRYDQMKSMESLETVWVSRANALQRKGRAGRIQEGVCFHLFTSHHFNYHLREQPIPEIQRACLEQLVLKIKMLPIFKDQEVKHVLEKLIEPPSDDAICGAVQRLTDLGALDKEATLTPLGYHVGSLPVDVRIGKLMLFGAIFRCLDSTLTIAATLSFKSPFVSPFGMKQESDERKKSFSTCNSDYLTMLNAYKGWIEAKKRNTHQAYQYCQYNFLSYKTLEMLASLKQQYVELLSDIGFIRPGIRLRDVERAARGGSDGVQKVTGEEANVNSENTKLLSAILVAALYPNVVHVLTPDIRYSSTSSGSVQKSPNPEDFRFKTKYDGYVYIHPTSVNFQARHFASPYLVYHEKVKTSKVFIRNCSMVSVYPLLLFGGGGIHIDLHQGNFVLSVDDGWIQFIASSPQVAELVRDLRYELDQLLSDKISQPDMDLLTCPRGSKIIQCIVELITSQ